MILGPIARSACATAHPPTMPRKLKKGYFVRGQFVAEGSELDLELKRELKGSDEPSRTDLKRESTELQKLGQELLTLRAEAMPALALPDKLLEALVEARRISNFEGKRRQMQYVGKLMRQIDDDTLAAIRAALGEQHSGSASQTLALHLVEGWRDRLIAEDEALGHWLDQFPATDAQQLRALVRQARKDALPTLPHGAPRHGSAYRDLFAVLREHLGAAAGVTEPQGAEHGP